MDDLGRRALIRHRDLRRPKEAAGGSTERQLKALADHHRIRVVGPNCLGIISTGIGLDASFAPVFPNRGSIALMSQSGALATAIIDWSVKQNIGFSKFVSFGNAVDVGVIDLLRAWEDDPETKVIVGYVEGLPNGPEFIRVAREVSAKKPIIVKSEAMGPGRAPSLPTPAASPDPSGPTTPPSSSRA
jgi:acetyltransferase